ncbi:MAG: TonB-dependent receptor family protein [Bacteroidales bacterium]|jgi:outer membrane receptor protein involved in Fe transport|nr:TonB-dependent receptor family protein [Bacteroidales bacterium]
MNTKAFTTLYLLVWGICSIFAQTNQNLSISGNLLDQTSKVPIEYASVALYRLPDTTLITGVITNSEGMFALTKIAAGNYLIRSSFVGYETLEKTLALKNTSFQFSEPLQMKQSVVLTEVVVETTRNERQISVEKTQINVSRSISQVSGNVADILRNQSGVTMDMEDNIYLRGNKNILVLIDGIPTTATALNTMPSSSVDNIEIITNPDVRYDAEGTGGIINIVTKRQSLQGLSGRMMLNYGISDRLNGGVNLQYKKGIFGVDFSYNGRYEKIDIESELTRKLHAQNTLIEQHINAVQTNNVHNTALLLSAMPNKTETYTLTIRGLFPKFVNEQNIQGKQTNELSNTTPFNRINDITWSRKVLEGAFSYKKTFERNKHELSVNATFSRTDGNRPAQYYIDNQLAQKASGGGNPTNATLQIDYLKSIFKRGKIETGLRGFIRGNTFKYDFYDLDFNTNQWIVNPAFSNDLEHREYIYATYLMYSDSLSKKLTYKIGARLEYSTSDLLQKSITDTIDKEFWHPFPYFQLQYNINQSQNLALTFNRRITRPTYPQLNPIINIIDHTIYETGNKNLNPETADMFEINHAFIKQKLQLRTALFFSTIKDFITQVTLLSPPDNLILTFINGNRENKIGGNFDINYNLNKYVSINPAFSFFHAQTTGQYNEIDLGTKNWAWTGNCKITIKPEKQTEIQTFFNYNSPSSLPQFDLDQIYYVDIAIKRTFLKNKLTASFTVSDIFNTNKWNIQSDNKIYNLKNYSKNETRIFWVGLTYNFNAYRPDSRLQRNGGEGDRGVIRLGQ